MIPISYFLILGAVIFAIGLFGALTKRNAIGILMSFELMANAININLLTFSAYLTPSELTGQVFALFVIVVAAAQIGVGLALVMYVNRFQKSINVDDINLMKW